MAESENIGSISIGIVGDYSKLQSDIDAATGIAAQGGQEIAEALTKGASGADAISGALTSAASAAATFEEQIAALVNTGSTLAEALAAVQSASEGIASGVGAAGEAAAEAAQQMNLFDEAMQVPYAEAAGQLNMFATELEPIPGAAIAAAESVKELGTAEEEAGEHAHHAAGELSELGEKLVAFGEALAITEGLKEFGAEALAASDGITRANISLTVLTGSAEKAKETVEGLEKLGIQDGLSFPSLLKASQRMQNLLGPAADVTALLGKIADGATVMNSSIEAAANSFDRVATSGTLASRQLQPLGLTLDKVAAAMNELSGKTDVTASNAVKMFKALGEGAEDSERTQMRIEVLSTALDKLGGIAQETAEKTFGGQWMILSNQWEQIMREVGDALMPVITGLTDLMKVDVLPWIKDVVDGFRSLPAPVQDVVVGIGLLAATIVPITLAIGGIGLAFSAAATALAPLATAAMEAAGGIKAFALAEDGAIGMGASLTLGLVSLAAGFAAVAFNVGGVADKMGDWLDKQGVNLSAWFTGFFSFASEAEIKANSLAASLDSILQRQAVSPEHLKNLQAMTSFTDAAAKAGQAEKALLDPTAALGAKMQYLAEQVTATRDKLANVTAKFKETGEGAAEVAKAYDAWQGATNALKSAHEALLPVVENVQRTFKDFVAPVLTFPTAAQSAVDAFDALLVKTTDENHQLAEAQRWLDTVMERWRNGAATYKEVAAAADLLASKQKALNATQEELEKTLGSGGTSIMKGWVDDVRAAAPALDALIGPLQEIPPYVRTAADAMHDLGLKTDEAGNIIQTKLLAAYAELGQYTHTIDEEAAAWSKVSASVDKLARTNLPEALKLYDEHYQQLVQLGAKEGEILAFEAKRLQTVIAIDEQSGAAATKEIVNLEMVRLKQQALYDSTHAWGDMYVGIMKGVVNAYDQLGKSIADAIVDGKSFADVFIQAGKQIEKMIMEQLVGFAFKELKTALVGLIADSGVLGSTLSGALGGLGKAAVGGMTPAMEAAGNAAQSAAVNAAVDAAKITTSAASTAAQTATSAAGAAAQSTTKAASSLMGTITGVSAAVSAVSSVISNFQMAGMNKSLDLIVNHTLRIYNDLANLRADEWDRYGHIYDRLGEIWNSIREGLGNIFGREGEILAAMRGETGPAGETAGGGGEDVRGSRGGRKTSGDTEDDRARRSREEWEKTKQAALKAEYDAGMAAKQAADEQLKAAIAGTAATNAETEAAIQGRAAAAASVAAANAATTTATMQAAAAGAVGDAAREGVAAAASTAAAAGSARNAAAAATAAADSASSATDSVATSADAVANSAELLSGAIENTGAKTELGLESVTAAISEVASGIRDTFSTIAASLVAGFASVVAALGGVPQMQEGGMVPRDMLAFVHSGEMVVPARTAAALVTLPSLPQLSYAVTPSASTYTNSSTVNSASVGSVHFAIYDQPDPRETARQVADTLKTLSPRFMAYIR